MDYRQVKVNIDSEGISWELDDQQIADAYNAIEHPTDYSPRRITAATILEELGHEAAGRIASGLIGAAESTDSQVAALAQSIHAAAVSGDSIDVGSENVRLAITVLVVGGVIGEADGIALTGLAGRAKKYQPISSETVRLARMI